MKAVAIKSSEHYWLGKYSSFPRGYDFPWQGDGEPILTQFSNCLSAEASTEILRICNNDTKALLTYFTSAAALVLSKYIASQEIVFSTSWEGNRFPIKTQMKEEDTLQEVLNSCGSQVVEGIKHLHFSYGEFIEKINIRHGQEAARSVSSIQVDYENTEVQNQEVHDPVLAITITYDNNQFVVKASTWCLQGREDIVINLVESCVSMIAGVRQLLPQRIASIDVLGNNQRERILRMFNKPVGEPVDYTFLDLFKEHVKNKPDARALLYRDEQVTYATLDERANEIASSLLKQDTRKGDVVAVLLTPCIDMIASLIGILKAGAAFLPIDPDYPNDRIQYLLSDSKAKVLITSTDLEVGRTTGVKCVFVEKVSGVDSKISPPISPTDLAYVIYTSGTTGTPNGVMVEHAALVNLCHWHNLYYEVEAGDISTKYAGFGFDASVWEIFPYLANGAALYIVEDVIRHSIVELNRSFVKQGVTISFLPTQVGEQFMTLKNNVLKKLLVGGDKLRRINEKIPYQVYNNYGPTENAVVATAGRIEKNAGNISIGKPIDNVEIHILSPGGETVQPIGVAGELCVAGRSLARGYLGKSELTARKFVHHPSAGAGRLYRTGDQARWLPDGNIEFLGRIDSQIKIRGYRVEVEEIEKVLLNHSGISEAVVVKKTQNNEQEYLCAYYTGNESLTSDELKLHAKRFLPEYMVPTRLLRIDKIPFTPNGKVDRALLTKKQELVDSDDRKKLLPTTPVQKTIYEVWKEVLRCDGLGIDDNFFVLGGDSIMAMQIESRLLNKGYSWGTKGIFEYPTVRKLSETVSVKTPTAFQGEVIGEVELTPIQRAFFNSPTIPHKHHYNQALMLHFNQRIEEATVREVFTHVQSHHDALRTTYQFTESGVVQTTCGSDMPIGLSVIDWEADELTNDKIREACNAVQQSIDLVQGPLMKVLLLQTKTDSRVAIFIHHLVVDAVSWRILLNDVGLLFEQIRNEERIQLPPKSDSYKVFADSLSAYAQSAQLLSQLEYWKDLEDKTVDKIIPKNNHEQRSITLTEIAFTASRTHELLTDANKSYSTTIQPLLIAALSKALYMTFSIEKSIIWLESHGREKIDTALDFNRTLGWFTSLFPFYSEVDNATSIEKLIIETKDGFNRIPQKGIGYGVLKHLSHQLVAKDSLNEKDITFNYLGQFDFNEDGKNFSVSNDLVGNSVALENGTEGKIDCVGLVTNRCLKISFYYNPYSFDTSDIELLAANFKLSIESICDHCMRQNRIILTPTDFTYSKLSAEVLSKLSGQYEISDIYRLSPSQEGMLFHSLLNAKAFHYYQLVQYDIAKHINNDLAEHALRTLFNRHDILRTLFLHKGLPNPLQVVLKTRDVQFQFIDATNFSHNEVVETLLNYKKNDKYKGFDLAADTLLRLFVIANGRGSSTFVWTFHHIIMDGWCAVLLRAEFHRTYADLESGRDIQIEPKSPFKNYIQWLESRDVASSKVFWKNYFNGFENLTPINIFSVKQDEYQLINEVFHLSEQASSQLREQSSQYEVTLNSLLQAIWSVVLGRFSNSGDVVFGRVVAGRPAEVVGVEEMIGVFINTMPLRVYLNPSLTVFELAKQIQLDSKFTEDHQHFPLSEVQKLSGLGEALIDHIFAFENYPGQHSVNDSMEMRNVEVFGQTNYDFNIVVVPDKKIKIIFKYNAAVFSAEIIQRIKQSVERIVEQTVQENSIKLQDLAIIAPPDERKIHTHFNRAELAEVKDTFLDQFELIVHQFGGRRALIHHDQNLTYTELNKRSECVGVWLQAQGVKPGQIVAVMMDKSIDMIIAVIGVLRTGAAFLPIDPQYPTDRITHIVKDSKSSVVVSERKHKMKFSTGGVVLCMEDLERKDERKIQSVIIEPDALAYVIYTSGTTGLPNGVMIGHKGLSGLCHWHKEFYKLTENEISTKYAGFGFDATVWEIFPVLASGGALYVVEEDVKYNVLLLNERFLKFGVTNCFLPTSLGEQFMTTCKNPILKKLLVGGEKLKAVEKNLSYQVFNNYGPTENTVVSTVCKVDSSMPHLPIGKPIDTTQAFILARNSMQHQPIGIPGELCVSGPGLAKGYLGKDELTAAKFVINPFLENKRIYRTGDLVRWLEDGNIEFLGRIDQQVKIRGYRIELSEIENVIIGHDQVSECAVIVKSNVQGHHFLCAFFTGAKDLSENDLRFYVSQQLPFYMVPSSFSHLDQMPINQNGKVDRGGLVQLAKNTARGVPTVIDANEIEKTLSRIWCDVLRRQHINLTDNFFDLGGTSLDMIQVSEKVEEVFQIQNSIVQMFKYPTPQLFSGYLKQVNNKDSVSTIVTAPSKDPEIIRQNRLRQREKRKI